MTNQDSLAEQIRQVAKLSGTFLLRSGVTSDTYFDKYLLESDPQLLRTICEQMACLVPEETDILAGLELGGIPIVTMLSHLMGFPCAFIRKEPKAYGTRKNAEGPSLEDKRVTLIKDVVSSGGAISDALAKFKVDGIIPVGIVCVIDRQSGGTENLLRSGHELRSLLTMTDIESAA